MDVGALPVIQTAPWGQDKHPLLSLQQCLQQRCNSDIDIPAEIEAFWGVDIIQKVPEQGARQALSWEADGKTQQYTMIFEKVK